MSARRLRVEERAEHRGPASLEILILLQSTLQQSFDSLLRFRPRKCRLKRVEGVEEPVGRWQRDPINESFRRRNCPPIEGCYPARKRIDEAVEVRIWKRPG